MPDEELDDLDRVDAWDWPVPEHLIATHPSERRSGSRLLVARTEARSLEHRRFEELDALLRPGDLLVVNDVRVGHVRLRGRRASGGAVEILVVGVGHEGRWTWGTGPVVAMARSNRSLREGEEVELEPGPGSLRYLGRDEAGLTRWDVLPGVDIEHRIASQGELPLPPYILKRRRALAQPEQDEDDRHRYQTVFAKRVGAVAAPTAALHFDAPLLARLREAGVGLATVTLHVGIGTFRPVTAERMSEHAMHREHYEVPESTAEAIHVAREGGRRVIAVGTTVVRTLEAAALEGVDGRLATGWSSTDLMIRPGFAFRVVDGLITNFHLPRSTLLALVSALGGYGFLREAYRVAVANEYRFFSYGDAMLLLPEGESR